MGAVRRNPIQRTVRTAHLSKCFEWQSSSCGPPRQRPCLWCVEVERHYKCTTFVPVLSCQVPSSRSSPLPRLNQYTSLRHDKRGLLYQYWAVKTFFTELTADEAKPIHLTTSGRLHPLLATEVNLPQCCQWWLGRRIVDRIWDSANLSRPKRL